MSQIAIHIKPYKATCLFFNNQEHNILSLWDIPFEEQMNPTEQANLISENIKHKLDENLLKLNPEIKLIIDNPFNCLVPAELYKKELEKTYLKSSIIFEGENAIGRELINNQNIVNVFIEYPEYAQTIKKYFELSHIKTKHASSIFLDELFWQEAYQRPGPVNAYVCFYKDYLSVAITKSKQLHIYNVFQKKEPKDLYTLLKSILTKIKPNELYHLIVFGETEPEDQYLKILAPLFKNILFWTPRNPALSHYKNTELDHRYGILISSL